MAQYMNQVRPAVGHVVPAAWTDARSAKVPNARRRRLPSHSPIGTHPPLQYADPASADFAVPRPDRGSLRGAYSLRWPRS